MKPIVIHHEAQREMDESFTFYEGRRPGLGFDFIAEVEEATQRIQQWPKLPSRFSDTDYRRCVVKRFPYLIFFRETDDEIRVIALAHAKRKPGYWLNRTFDDE